MFFRHERDDRVLVLELGLQLLDGALLLRRGGRLDAPRPSVFEHRPELIEDLALPDIKQAELDPVLVTQVRDRDFIGQVTAQDGGLLGGGKLAALLLGHALLLAPKYGAGGSHISTEAEHANDGHMHLHGREDQHGFSD